MLKQSFYCAIKHMHVKLMIFLFMHLVLNACLVDVLISNQFLFAQTQSSKPAISQTAVGSDQPRYAIFWSNLNTWIVSLDEKKVYQSNHLYGKSHYLLFEYFLTTQSKRREKENHPYGWIYRWVSLDRHLLQSHFVDQLTRHFLDSEVEGDFFDEHRVLQFTNETITLGRWVEQHLENGQLPISHRMATIYTIDLENRTPISASKYLPEK